MFGLKKREKQKKTATQIDVANETLRQLSFEPTQDGKLVMLNAIEEGTNGVESALLVTTYSIAKQVKDAPNDAGICIAALHVLPILKFLTTAEINGWMNSDIAGRHIKLLTAVTRLAEPEEEHFLEARSKILKHILMSNPDLENATLAISTFQPVN